MVMTELEREVIVKSVGSEREREATETARRRKAMHQIRRANRPAGRSSARISIGILLMRAGARLAGIRPEFMLERNQPDAGISA